MACSRFFAAPAVLLAACCCAAEIGEKNIAYVDYPGFPDAHSTWGSIGYCSAFRKVFIGVTNHRDRVGLFEYDIDSRAMSLRAFVPEAGNLRRYQWQGKIHSQIVEGPGGAMYFATDGGESREEYLMEHPHGYAGGFVFRWDPAAGRLTNLGVPKQYDSIKDLAVDSESGRIFMVSYPQVRLLLYDPRSNDLRDLGRVGSDHVPRVVFRDRWNNFYYVDWRQRLVKYERGSEQLVFARESLPAFPGTPGGQIVTGIKAHAADPARGVIYLITFGAKVLVLRPQEEGIGPVEDLGAIYDAPGRAPYSLHASNLCVADNGRLYYFIGGHGAYALEGRTVLMELDPRTKTKRTVMTFPLNVISEVTGSGVRDPGGTLYFAGRRDDRTAASMGESGASRPFLIVFHPEKAVR
jgi:hypothetical protein